MAKDPAMLWYWSDWNSGTSLLSRFIKGCYMDLLHAQFNNGRLSLEEIKVCLGSDFGTSWPSLQKKFKQDEKGLFFNARLELEKDKRASFCDSRRKNKEKKTHDRSYDEHMTVHMENANVNTIKNVLKGVQGEISPDDEDDGPMPLGHDMYMLFLKTNPTYPQMPSKDCPAIMDIGLFIHIQNSGSQVSMLHFSKEERAVVLHEWGRWCDWYKAYGGNDDLAYIQKFKQQKIFSELKNGKKYGSNQGFDTNGKNTGGKSAGANLLVTKLEESLRTG